MDIDVFTALRRVLPNGHTIVHECRRCGTNAASDSTPCSNCGHDSIARYEIL